jgi:hypothetical protein
LAPIVSRLPISKSGIFMIGNLRYFVMLV